MLQKLLYDIILLYKYCTKCIAFRGKNLNDIIKCEDIIHLIIQNLIIC